MSWDEQDFANKADTKSLDPYGSVIVMPYTDVEEIWLQKQVKKNREILIRINILSIMNSILDRFNG